MGRQQELGQVAELNARKFLISQGMQFVEANYRGPRGEIDLVMRDRQITVFVEVRYRRHRRFGSGAESVDQRKQEKLLATAAYYLQRHPRAARSACRFDVVSFSFEQGEAQLEWIADAFRLN